MSQVHQAKYTLEGLMRYDPASPQPGRLTPEEAHAIAQGALEEAETALALWNEPTFMIHDAYFFTRKAKFDVLLAGVLVDSNDGTAVLIDTDFTVNP